MQTFFKRMTVVLTVIAVFAFSMTAIVGCKAVPGGDGASTSTTIESTTEESTQSTVEEESTSSTTEDSSIEESSSADSSSEESSSEDSSSEDSSSEDSSSADSSFEDSSSDDSSSGTEEPPVIEPDKYYKAVNGAVTESDGVYCKNVFVFIYAFPINIIKIFCGI